MSAVRDGAQCSTAFPAFMAASATRNQLADPIDASTIRVPPSRPGLILLRECLARDTRCNGMASTITIQGNVIAYEHPGSIFEYAQHGRSDATAPG